MLLKKDDTDSWASAVVSAPDERNNCTIEEGMKDAKKRILLREVKKGRSACVSEILKLKQRIKTAKGRRRRRRSKERAIQDAPAKEHHKIGRREPATTSS